MKKLCLLALIVTVIPLSACPIAGPSFPKEISLEDIQEGESCFSSDEDGETCPSPLTCSEGICRLVCQKDSECAKKQTCTNNICLDVPNPLCVEDADCQFPGACEILSGAYCEAARCHYMPKAKDTPCDDGNICTVSACDGEGRCVGTPKICDTPPAANCNENDDTYYTYSQTGICESVSNKGCVYTESTKACPNCRENCLGFCQNVACTQPENNCEEAICDPNSKENQPCKVVNKADGIPCSTKDSSGVCSSGTCVECLKDQDCQNLPEHSSVWKECYKAVCKSNHCGHEFVPDTACGAKCDNNFYYPENGGKCVLADEANQDSAICSTTSATQCDDGYACKEDHSGCRTSCKNSDDCASTHYCHQGSCKLKIEDGKTGCQSDDACQSNHCDASSDGPETGRCCKNGECCDEVADCPAEFVCNKDTHICTSEVVGQACSGDGECNSVTYCHAGHCAMLLELGETCDHNNECKNKQCVDGVCCNTDKCGTCEACNINGHGTCDFVSKNNNDEGTCEGETQKCDGHGVCLKVPGQSCNDNNDCLNGSCVDDVCCTKNRCNTCEACNVAGSEGTCTLVQLGEQGTDCKQSAYRCDGFGACKKIDGESCNNPGDCLHGFCADNTCCDTACNSNPSCSGITETHYRCDKSDSRGTCVQDTSSCAPYVCGDTSCKTSCTSNNDCSDNYVCIGEQCVSPRSNGGSCSDNSHCQSSHCMDGVCCSSSPISTTCSGQGDVTKTYSCGSTTKFYNTSCGYYKCASSTSCKTSCTGSSDCISTASCKRFVSGQPLGCYP